MSATQPSSPPVIPCSPPLYLKRLVLTGLGGGVMAALLARFTALDLIYANLLLATACGWIAGEYTGDRPRP